MKSFNRSARGAGALVLLVALTACGGGGGGGNAAAPAPSPPVDTTPPPPALVEGTDVPVSATQNGAGALSFVSQLASSANDTAEPLVIGNAALGTSETDEPAVVN